MIRECVTSRLTGEFGYREECEGSGSPLDSAMAILFGVGRCPVCHGLANVDDNAGIIETHTVLVIDYGEDK